jgi:hypothetical protein
MALTNTYKFVAICLGESGFQLVEEAAEGFEGPQILPLISAGISGLNRPLLVSTKA